LSQGTKPVHGAMIAERRDQLRALLRKAVSGAASLVLEVGSGHGHFLTAYSAAHPKELCIGIDIASDRVGRANRKRERARLSNLHFILADSDDFLDAMPDGVKFSAVFILFPDPWPKRRHEKHRVFKPAFLDAIAAKTVKGTGLYFRTDHEPYFRDAVDIVRAHPGWIESDPSGWPFEEPTVFQKRAERHFTLVAARG
jgi:tRNA (guanine-N7-)-methyltransferase